MIDEIRIKYKKLENKKIFVGVSGGVDSSVILVLLKEAGFNVEGFYLECWDSDYKYCKADQDYQDVLRVGAKYNININKIDMKNEYRKTVLLPFIEAYKSGKTPNPDVLCNKEIKFGLLFNKINKISSDYIIATGHYAKIDHINKEELINGVGGNGLNSSNNVASLSDTKVLTIAQGTDIKKDQSYFLYRLINNENLNKIIFPLGHYLKKDVREIANKLDIPVKNKPDSQGICFIGDVKLRDFISDYIKNNKGEVKLENGEVVGMHDGIHLYTIGQRHGFTLNKYFGRPMYVIRKDFSKNVLYIGNKEDANKNALELSNIATIIDEEYLKNIVDYKNIYLRIRNLGKKYEIKSIKFKNSKLIIETSEEMFGVAPGQSGVVYYKDKIILGGEII